MPMSSHAVHRVTQTIGGNVADGIVRWSPVKSLWWSAMAATTLIGGALTFRWPLLLLFLAMTALVLLFGHSLGSHRKLIHDSFQCPRWLEYALVYSGVQVGLGGPIGLLRQHELRDYAQRQHDCHAYLRHGSSFWADGWWQLHCELTLRHTPHIAVEARIVDDLFYRFLERTWMLQQLPLALVLYLCCGWGGVVWGVSARITACVAGHWLIGYFAHNRGGMHHHVDGAAVQGHNIALTSLLTMGECWHNNHHAFPGSARLGWMPGEWDPGWWTLVALNKMGLVWDFVLPDDLPARSELRLLEPVCVADAPVLPVATLRQTMQAAATLLAARPALQLQGPCATLSLRRLRAIAGPHAVLSRVVKPGRLELMHGAVAVRGLPALVIAAGVRHPLAAVLAALLLPCALLGEAVRREFEMASHPASAG
jgi:stearoyl-CoA desaturase (delta-9 desaturase)